jgi:hypothetical protein
MSTNDQWVAYFEFLDEYRASGRGNVYGVAPELAQKFGITLPAAKSIFITWMETFNDEDSAAVRAARMN